MHVTSSRTVALLLASVCLLAGTAGAASRPSPTPSYDPNRATFGVQPSTATALDRRPYLSYDVTPGSSLADHVAVVNYSVRPLVLKVYATDAFNDDRGGFALLQASVRPTDAGTWIALGTPGGRGAVTVPAQSRAIVPLHLIVPQGASPGDHVAGVIASLSELSKDKNGLNVLLDQRVATRVYIRVAGPLRAGLQVENLHASYRDNWNPIAAGSGVLTFRVHNVGNVKLGGLASVRVSGLLGSTVNGPKLAPIPLLLPGGHVDLRVVVPHVWPELLETATVSVRPLVLPGDADPGLHVYTASTHFWAIPWVILAIVVAAWLVWRWRRSRRRPARHAAPKNPEPVTLVTQ